MIRDSILSVSPQLQVTMPDSVSLLGSPLGDIDCISDTIQLKVSNLETMGVRLQRMHAHGALQLLWHSFALPKMMHILRTAPCFLSSCLTSYDDLLRSILSGIVIMSTSKKTTSLGRKLHSQLSVVDWVFGALSSWHPPPSWPQLLAPPTSSTRSSHLVSQVSPIQEERTPSPVGL